MNYYYSATTNAFYPEDLLDAYKKAGSFPADAVSCTQEVFDIFSAEGEEGKHRGSLNGKPAWVKIPEKTLTELATEERFWRDVELARADIELNKVQDGVGVGTVAAWRAYRVELRNWPEAIGFPLEGRPVSP